MTDNEITKALEEWIKALKDDYKRLQALDAPMDCFEESHTDNIRILSNALDLINRKNTEIDFVKSSRKLAEASVNTLKAELDLAKAFHKEAVAERDLLNIQLKEAKAEIERLQNDVGKEFTCFVGEPHKVEHCPYLEELETATVEAVKEVLKQLEAEVESSDKYIREYEDTEKQRYWNIGLRHALKVVKRMVGDSGD